MSKVQSTIILQKYFLSTRSLINGAQCFRGRIIGRVDDKLYMAEVFDQHGAKVGTLTVSTSNMHEWAWFEAMPSADFDRSKNTLRVEGRAL